ncbi:MAG: riboflavin biosynthesis protein RibF [Atopostipes suicloacalis]|nr:riboflavin biosynthesis protein RibF [Atopostipes suicloacalis]MDN6731065.1 riboflavin biosynthesis protein RibF [Atopostipes suicloacalis]
MEIIEIKHPYKEGEIVAEEIVLILGYFDGIHIAHQHLIKEGIRIGRERNLKVALMTFNRRPKIIYEKIPEGDYDNLTQFKQKVRHLENLGIDILYKVFFNSEFGNISPEDFVEHYIVKWNAKVVVAGYDYTYGKPELASINHLPLHAKGRFEVIKIGEEKKAGKTISSTQIRNYIKAGKMEEANQMLGYFYETLGFVIRGDARGRELGYPTANIYSHPYTLLPKNGIYAVYFIVKGERYSGMASIGYNVTFKDEKKLSVEVNIFDFDDQIYGDDVKIEWVSYLRSEKKFHSKEELIEQLNKDERNSREILENK